MSSNSRSGVPEWILRLRLALLMRRRGFPLPLCNVVHICFRRVLMKCGIGGPLVLPCSSHCIADGNLLWDNLCWNRSPSGNVSIYQHWNEHLSYFTPLPFSLLWGLILSSAPNLNLSPPFSHLLSHPELVFYLSQSRRRWSGRIRSRHL